MTKRDLAELCLEGLLEATEQQQQVQLAALLQAGFQFHSAVCVQLVFMLDACSITKNFTLLQFCRQ